MRKLSIVVQLLVPILALVAFAGAAVSPPNLEKALDAQRALVERQPTAERWNDLGNLLHIAGKNGEAREAYDSALFLDPELASAHYNLGLLLRQQGDDGRALDHFRRVVEVEPDNAWGWFQVGSLLEAKGSEGAAVRAYARAFALDPRLSFSDLNPQLIDSELTTQALLAAHRELPEGTEAPLAYEDPRHIRKLLLPQPPAASPTPTPGPDVAGATAAPVPDDGRVLRPQDLRPGSSSGGVRGGVAPPTGRPGAQPGYEAPGYGELLRQQLELQQQQEQDQIEMQDQMQTEEGGEVAPEGVYVPGIRSSAQLRERLDDLPG